MTLKALTLQPFRRHGCCAKCLAGVYVKFWSYVLATKCCGKMCVCMCVLNQHLCFSSPRWCGHWCGPTRTHAGPHGLPPRPASTRAMTRTHADPRGALVPRTHTDTGRTLTRIPLTRTHADPRGPTRTHAVPPQWIECLKLFLIFNDVRNICYIALRIAWETTFIYDFCLVPIYGFPPLSQLTNPNSKSSFFTLFGFRR